MLSAVDVKDLLKKNHIDLFHYMTGFVEEDHLIENLRKLLEVNKKRTLTMLDILFTIEYPRAKYRISECDNGWNEGFVERLRFTVSRKLQH